MRSKINIFTLGILFIVFAIKPSYAQQEYLASQYNFNSLMLNPAYAGAHTYLQSSSMYRSQWKVNGAPTSQVVCVDGTFKKAPIGIGFIMTSDRIGIVSEKTYSADLSYGFRTSLGRLSFGLRAGYVDYSARLSDLEYWDEDDPVYNTGNIQEGFLTLGFGAFMSATSGRWYAGLSSPSYYAKDEVLRPSKEVRFYKRHYYLYGGGVKSTSIGLDIKPSFLVRYMEDSPPLLDLNIHALFMEKGPGGIQVWLGAGYRTSATYLASLEVILPLNLRLGYSYDFAGKGLNTYLGATHEIQIGFNFGGRTPTIQNPRYF
ncbi:MAG: PorP/SprF family type IX secretion system membrane protein [Flavobacteriales bacterium]